MEGAVTGGAWKLPPTQGPPVQGPRVDEHDHYVAVIGEPRNHLPRPTYPHLIDRQTKRPKELNSLAKQAESINGKTIKHAHPTILN